MIDWDPFYHVNSAYNAFINWAGGETGTAQAAQAILESQVQQSENIDKKSNLLLIAAGLGAVWLWLRK